MTAPQAGIQKTSPPRFSRTSPTILRASRLRTFINTLNEGEQAYLVALAGLGRGTFSDDQFDEAFETAGNERVNTTPRYLSGMPLPGC
jgi:hypothetical protein